MSTFSDELRKTVQRALKPCPTCKTYRKSQRQLCREIGVLDPTIIRFLRGKAIGSGTLDKLVSYFRKVQP